MGEIVLVRHGQANSGAMTEEEYDRLSDLGKSQAVWLGEWMRAHEPGFDLVLSGTMRRHIETAKGLGLEPERTDPRLNEVDYFALARDMEINHGIPQPRGLQDYATHLPQTLAAWEKAEIAGTEPFDAFECRVSAVLEEAAEPGRRVLCVTSGGVISMALRIALGLDIHRLAQILLPISNSSIHRFRVLEAGIFLSGFNAVPHLDHPDRKDLKTYV
ncbi:MAG: histidine phosphatase family protein [Pseudomonadota bacterium]